MTKRQIQLIFNFYGRFSLSFTSIGYHCRRMFWRESSRDLKNKNVLVTGASGGIGSDVVLGTLESGATVFAAARNQKKLDQLRDRVPAACKEKMKDTVFDLSLQSDIRKMVDGFAQSGEKIDVLVNNVGLMIHDLTITEEGFETSFATNILNHYLLTKTLIEKDLLSEDAVIINISSGGMYNAPLLSAAMNNTTPSHNGGVAYTLHKRAQVALTGYWRKKHQDSKMSFYVMHPGWVDTDGVKTALPTFRKFLQLILRDEAKGADTIKWLAREVPAQSDEEKIWFDRKPRNIHLNNQTLNASCSKEELVDFLESQIL